MHLFKKKRKAVLPSDLEAYYLGVQAAIAAAQKTSNGHQTHLESLTLQDAVGAIQRLLNDSPKCRKCQNRLGMAHAPEYIDKGYTDFYVHPCGYGVVEIGQC